jgi:hypothetical protein
MRSPVREFVFTDPDLATSLDRDLPVKLTKMQELIERVAVRYPLIEKMEVSRVVKTFFQSFRELLILGCSLSFQEIASDIQLNFHPAPYQSYQVIVSLTTSPFLKETTNDLQ